MDILRFALFNKSPVFSIMLPALGSIKNNAVKSIYIIKDIISDFLFLSLDSRYARKATPGRKDRTDFDESMVDKDDLKMPADDSMIRDEDVPF